MSISAMAIERSHDLHVYSLPQGHRYFHEHPCKKSQKVRFCGAGDPYDKLKRALRADIDESAWQALYRTESLPFPAPKTGKIAIKVINHYGDEVLKVFAI